MIYPSFKPQDVEVSWKSLDNLHGYIRVWDGLVVFVTEDGRAVVLDYEGDK